MRANVRRGEIHKVVARSPDLATSPTEGLQSRPRRETCGPADGGVWRPSPNSRRVEIGKLFPACSLSYQEWSAVMNAGIEMHCSSFARGRSAAPAIVGHQSGSPDSTNAAQKCGGA